MAAQANKVLVTPLGGFGELGMNMLAIDDGEQILVLDAGLMLPEEEMLGIDCVIPDISYLLENKNRLQGIVVTHGHESHIGALPYILKDLPVPVYGTPLTIALLRNKLGQIGNNESQSILKQVTAGTSVQIGSFLVDFIRVSHNIPDAVALGVHTRVGTIVYSGDFKFDQTPVGGQLTDFHRLAELGDQGVLLLLSESVNAENPGYTISEREMGHNLNKNFTQAKERLLIVAYPYNLHLVSQVLELAREHGRKVSLIGKNLISAVRTAAQLGYLKIPTGLLIDLDELTKLPTAKQLVLAGGGGGDPFSILAPLGIDNENKFKILAGDTVVFTAGSAPRTGKLSTRIIDQLFLEGAHVIYDVAVDVCGHASQEELKMMINIVRPRYFIPMHGEYRHLVQHADLAEAVGVPHERIIFLDNGNVLELNRSAAQIIGKVATGQILVDGLGVGDVGKVVLRDRRQLSQDGILIAVITMTRDGGEVVAGPDIISRGFVYVRESEVLMEEAKEQVREVLIRCSENRITEWSTIKNKIRECLGKFLYEKTRRRPMILPIIMEI